MLGWIAIEAESRAARLLLGLVIGVSAGLHASNRIVMLVVALAVALVALAGYVRRRELVKVGVTDLALVILLIFIGFGPQILFIPLEVLAGSGRVGGMIGLLRSSDPAVSAGAAAELWLRYKAALEVYVLAPLEGHFEGQILTDAALSCVMAIGLAREISGRRVVGIVSLLLFLLVPLTNGALTEIVRGGHRYEVLAPIIARTGASGAEGMIRLVAHVPRVGALAAFALTALVIAERSYHGITFFSRQIAVDQGNRLTKPLSFMLRYATFVLERHPELRDGPGLCIQTAPHGWLADEMRAPHVTEFFYYFLPNRRVTMQADERIPEGYALYFSRGCERPVTERRWRLYSFCETPQYFLCPLDPITLQIYIAAD